ncbi:uncharacterized protein LOC118558811 [Fundulus heteroclitus]|uniref:uncharacterized protein LOC118558811 n=1 Tax=Fundulus heteroclitus TaxID=8078 RepID=UPI00165A68B0|nr:uncharacterized protein LOC118558811 [Fundulus heteroclitus]
MASGLVKRYQQAGVDPPVALYVDCGCCAEAAETTKLQARFSGWPQLVVRLDIWHFMQRLALGCTTDAHQLSTCHAYVDKHLTKDELALHCRRRTRGVDTTVRLLEELIAALMGPQGNDSLGVPLFDQERMEHIWRVIKKSSSCCYSGDLLHSVNKHYEKLFGRKLAPEFCPPARYTGELIGLQYLFQQTGQALQDMNPDSEETARLIEEHDAGVDEEDEGFSDFTDDPTLIDLEVSPSASSTVAPFPALSASSTVASFHSSQRLLHSGPPVPPPDLLPARRLQASPRWPPAYLRLEIPQMKRWLLKTRMCLDTSTLTCLLTTWWGFGSRPRSVSPTYRQTASWSSGRGWMMGTSSGLCMQHATRRDF